MRNKFLLFCLAMLCTTALGAESLDRVEPPCWWVGMHTDLQLMLHGRDIHDAKVTTDASVKGISVTKVTSTDNPDYLFVDVRISDLAKPGVYAFNLITPDGRQFDFDYELLKRLGHRITPRFPAIAALKTPPEDVRALKGIRAEARIALVCDGEALRTERGEILFAESGVSGIAAMQLARAAGEALAAGRRCAARIDFMPDADAEAALRERAKALPARGMEDFLNGIVPKRLGQTLVKAAGIDLSTRAGTLTGKAIMRLAGVLNGWTLPVTGVQGFDQAQVTAGGAALEDFDARNMRSLRAPGLFAAGEVLDVDGDCGGFNLQWAWSSALMAADGIEAYLEGGAAT